MDIRSAQSIMSAESHIELTPQEAVQLEELAKHLTARPDDAPEEFCRAAKRAAMHLPERLTETLYDFGRWGSPSGVLTVSGLPPGSVPETPPDNSRHLGESTTLARVQAICNEFLGHMIAYEAEGAGRLFQDMVPARASARTQTSLSSEVELEVHTEQAFSMLRPDYLSLACLRGDPNAHTYLLRASDIVSNVHDDVAKMLRQPLWTVGVDESFRIGGYEFMHGDVRGPVPIISGSDEDPFMLLDQDLMSGVDTDAQQLLDDISNLYLRHRRYHTLASGQLLILDNNRVAHGRSDYIARFDGTDRFIIRSFAVRDMAKSRYAREGDSRVIGARFS
jgi:L-asparagine oxygenase